jgi:hypothetical protein
MKWDDMPPGWQEDVCSAAAYDLEAARARGLPSAVYRPRILIDGNLWCALYGDDLQEGVAGFGSSPAEAMAAFNAAWTATTAAKTVMVTAQKCRYCELPYLDGRACSARGFTMPCAGPESMYAGRPVESKETP